LNLKKSSGLLLAWLLVFYSIVLASNCSKVRLAQSFRSEVTKSELKSSYFKPPTETRGPQRLVFIVDMSHSMVNGTCPTDIDGASPSNPGSSCQNFAWARDRDGHRLESIKNLLLETERAIADGLDIDLKIAIFPFTGGFKQIQRDLNWDVSFYPLRQYNYFLPVNESLRYIDVLLNQHNMSVKESSTNPITDPFMGTSVPAKALDKAIEKTLFDMNSLKEEGTLDSALYEVYLVSDGVPSPTIEDFEVTMNLLNCPSACMPGESGTCSPQICISALSEMRQNWGEPENNELEVVVSKIDSIKSLPLFYGEGQLRFSFLQIHPDRIESERNKPENNFIKMANSFFPQDAYANLVSDDFPTKPNFLMKKDFESFQMTAFYALNVNYRVGDNGQLIVDSDGDGLDDETEIKLGTDPLNSHSLGHGVCLDSIAVKPEYRDICLLSAEALQCDSEIDIDADGLSECEEMILRSNPLDYDQDGDSIPDGLEVIYGFFLNENDSRLDTSGDNSSNVVHFGSNASPYPHHQSIDRSALVSFVKKLLGRELFTNEGGQLAQTEGYQIEITNFPVAKLRGESIHPKRYRDRQKSETSLIGPMQLPFGGAPINKNRVRLFARVVDINNPTKARWLTSWHETSSGESIRNFLVDLSLLETTFARDGINAGE